MNLTPLKVALQGLFPLSPIAAAVQGLIAELQEEQQDRRQRYKEMGLGYPRRTATRDSKKRRQQLAQKQRSEAIIADDEEVLLALVTALEMME